MKRGPGTKAKRRSRAPDRTREQLLAAAFEEVHKRGFQAASLDAILDKAGVTKGALYHHFPDKAALGYAVVDEVVRAPVLEAYLGPLERSEGDPLTALQRVIRQRAVGFTPAGVELGCPLNNLAQEMSPLDEKFRKRVGSALDAWTEGFAVVLERARAGGTVRRDVDTKRVAAFLVAAIEGSFGMAKNAKSVGLLRSNLAVLAELLDGLRPRPPNLVHAGLTAKSPRSRAAARR